MVQRHSGSRQQPCSPALPVVVVIMQQHAVDWGLAPSRGWPAHGGDGQAQGTWRMRVAATGSMGGGKLLQWKGARFGSRDSAICEREGSAAVVTLGYAPGVPTCWRHPADLGGPDCCCWLLVRRFEAAGGCETPHKRGLLQVGLWGRELEPRGRGQKPSRLQASPQHARLPIRHVCILRELSLPSATVCKVWEAPTCTSADLSPATQGRSCPVDTARSHAMLLSR